MIEIVALSDAMRKVVRLAERVAATDANVLVTGESGAGKDALAAFIHSHSPRAERALVKIDCAALPSELLEAELFGYERGAFTGATDARPGRLEGAHKGTLVLDEIAHLSIDAQAKLLRVIEEREFERLGGRRTIKVDARLVALTNVDLDDAVKRRAFREDLFYRLSVVTLYVPPLRERRSDVPLLAEHFLRTASQNAGKRLHFSAEALDLLVAYDWPGNVRELENAIERAALHARGTEIVVEDLPAKMQTGEVRARAAQTRSPLTAIYADLISLDELERRYLLHVLEAVGGNRTHAAEILRIDRRTLYRMAERFGLKLEGEEKQRSENRSQESGVRSQKE